MMATLALLEGTVLFAAVWMAACWSEGWTAVSVVPFALALTVCGLGALYFHDAYDTRVAQDFGRRVLRSALALLVLLAPLAVMLPSSRIPVAATLLTLVLLFPTMRSAWLATIRSPLVVRRVLMLGTSPLALRLAEEITARAPWYRIVGLVGGERTAASSLMPWPMLGPLERLDAVIRETRPHLIIAALSERRGKLPVSALLEAQLRGVGIEEGVDVYERLTGKLPIEWLTPSPLIFSPGFRPAPVTQALARISSLIASVIGLALSAPLLGVIALLVRLDSPGPAFFVQERVGQGGRVFRLIKFRTMRPAGGARSEWARDNSDRITRVGHWLRKFRLDELPQLINVLRGDMNLVGPRPHPVSNFSLFVTVLRNCPELCEHIPYYSLRLAVRPGVTGWAQVRYRYANDLEEEVEKTCYDLYYIKHVSLWLDLRILLDTVKTVLAGHGAGAVAAPAPSKPLRPADVIRMPLADEDPRLGDRRAARRASVGALAETARNGERAHR